mmetsp:Transcript_1773/g.5780  ORF Transcript_1773/g.5780 Transcript_1773/m.5780 type:complete len:349 (+) Transcript_1773:175-1221(+)
MFADVHPKARRDKQRYKASSSGVPDVVDEEQPTLYEGYTRVAVPRPAGDDVACCVPKLATERDDRSFARLLRRRCILPYWFLLVFVRVAETSGQYLQTGGRGRGRDLDGFFRVRVDGRVRGAAGRAPPLRRARAAGVAPLRGGEPRHPAPARLRARARGARGSDRPRLRHVVVARLLPVPLLPGLRVAAHFVGPPPVPGPARRGQPRPVRRRRRRGGRRSDAHRAAHGLLHAVHRPLERRHLHGGHAALAARAGHGGRAPRAARRRARRREGLRRLAVALRHDGAPAGRDGAVLVGLHLLEPRRGDAGGQCAEGVQRAQGPRRRAARGVAVVPRLRPGPGPRRHAVNF